MWMGSAWPVCDASSTVETRVAKILCVQSVMHNGLVKVPDYFP